jgi:hypothetical protein
MHPRRARLPSAAAAALLAVLVLGGMAALSRDARSGYAQRPPGAEPPRHVTGGDSFRLFQDRNFSGPSDLKRPVTEFKPHKPPRLAGYVKDDMSSLRWALPEGVVVVLYDHSNARGTQFVIWGSGEVRDVVPWQFTDKVARWAWFYVGGVDDPPRTVLHGRATRPLGTRPTRAPVPAEGLFFFASGDFKGLRQKVDDLYDFAPGELHPITGPDGPLESLQSLQWSLPYGVVVMLYEKPDMTGRQFAVWGKGELSSTRRWGSTGAVAGWAWFFVGSPDVLATPEP